MDYGSADPDPKEIFTDPHILALDKFIGVLDINSVECHPALP